MTSPPQPRPDIIHLHETLAAVSAPAGPALPFGLPIIDDRMAGGGLDAHALHEIAPASPGLGDAAAAALFVAGIAARAGTTTVLWALTSFDLYAPGLEQAGLAPDRLMFAEARRDEEVLALAEDGLRHGTLGAVVAEVRKVGMTQTRRLQLAACEGRTPMLLLRAWKRSGECPLGQPSSAATRWRIGCAPSTPLGHQGVGRSRWAVELVRQRNGNPFTLTLEACDAQGRLALPAAAADRAPRADRPAARAA